MTVASRFLKRFGPTAFSGDPERSLDALKWLSDNDPAGTGQLVDDANPMIIYHFSDRSSLVFDVATKLFSKPQ